MALPWNELLLAVSEVRKALQHWTSLCRVHPQEPRWCSQNKQIHNPRAVMYVIQWCFRWVTLRQRELLPIHRAGHVILTRWDDIRARARRSEHRELAEAAMMGLAHGGSPDDKRKARVARDTIVRLYKHTHGIRARDRDWFVRWLDYFFASSCRCREQFDLIRHMLLAYHNFR